MTPEYWERVKLVYEEVRGLPAEDRAQVLAITEPTIRQEVESLLNYNDSSFLESGPSPYAAELVDPPPPKSLGSYRVLEVIGRGGMATVYRGERFDGHFQMAVAIKILREGIFGGDVRKRFVSECQILSDLNHPHIVRLFDGGVTDDGRPFIVEELIEGRPITDYARVSNAGLAEKIALFTSIVDAVAFAHDHGVVHRDIKPSNILVTNEGTVKLLDFSIAGRADSRQEGTLTRWHGWTPGYASPEQARGEEAGPASDVYSLGVLLFELLTERKAVDTSGLPSYEAARKTAEASFDLSSVPAPYSGVLRACLTKDRSKRPTAKHVKVWLGDPSLVPPSRAVNRRKVLALTAGVAATSLAAFKWALPSHQKSPRVLFGGGKLQREPAVSPDGRWIAYREEDANGVRLVIGDRDGRAVRVVERAPERFAKPIWSPDGRSLAFLRRAGELWDVMIASNDGSDIRQVGRIDGAGLAWTPDSLRLLVTHAEPGGGPVRVYLLHTIDRQFHPITNPKAGDWGDIDVAASGDGKHFAVARYTTKGDGDIWLLSFDGAVERRLTERHCWLNGLCFHPSRPELIVAAALPAVALYRVKLSGGVPEPIDTGAADSPVHPSVGGTGGDLLLVYSQRRWTTRLHVAGVSNGKLERRRVLLGFRESGEHPVYDSSGKKLAWLGRGGVWVGTADGRQAALKVPCGENVRELGWSPDSRQLVMTITDGGPRVWIADENTGAYRRLTGDNASETQAVWSSDGRWIYWRSDRSGEVEFYRRSWPGGTQIESIVKGAFDGAPSHDGRWFYYLSSGQTSKLKALDLATRQVAEVSGLPPLRPGSWSVRDDGLLYAVGASSGTTTRCYWQRPGSAAQMLVELPLYADNAIEGITWKPDLSEVVWNAPESDEDIWGVEGFV